MAGYGKFEVWIDNPTAENILLYDDLSVDSQRAIGFKAGQAASAKRVNTMLRQSSLITVALMQAFQVGTDYSAATSLETIVDAIFNSRVFKVSDYFNIDAMSNVSIKDDLFPDNANVSIGSATKKFLAVYATNFYGALNGNATSATNDSKNRAIVSTYSTNAVASDMWDMLMNLGQRPSISVLVTTSDLRTDEGFVGMSNVTLPTGLQTSDISVTTGSNNAEILSYDSSTGNALVRAWTQTANTRVDVKVEFKCTYSQYVELKNY